MNQNDTNYQLSKSLDTGGNWIEHGVENFGTEQQDETPDVCTLSVAIITVWNWIRDNHAGDVDVRRAVWLGEGRC